jgi:hypothetical protein
MPAVPVDSTIQVDLEVSRYQEFKEDAIVQIWGHVGDYEVSVWLPIDDERVRSLRKTAKQRRPRG